MNPVASVEIQARSTGLAGALREARAKFGVFADGVKSQLGKLGDLKIGKGSLGLGKHGIMSEVGKGFARDLGGQALGFLEDGASNTLEFEKALTLFGVAARKSPAEIESVRSSVNQLSKDTGTSRLELLQGRRALVDLAGASADSDQMMGLLAKTSKATGADMADVVGTVYALRTSMNVGDPELLGTLSGLVNQSKDGAVHFNQLAQELTSVAPQFANFGVKGREGAVQLGAFFQITRAGFKDAAETSTGLSGIFKGLGLHADRFAEAGVKVFNISKDGTKTFRPISEIFKDIDKSILAKNPDFLMKAFGRGEGYRAYDMIRKQKDKYFELIEAGEKVNTISDDYGTIMSSSGARIEKSLNAIKVAVAEAFTPERIEKFAALMEKIAKAAGKAVDFLSDSVDAITWLTGHGAPGDADTQHAEQEIFLDRLNKPGKSGAEQAAAERAAVELAKAYAGGGVDRDLMDPEHKYGSGANVVAASKRFLKSEGYAEGWDYGANVDRRGNPFAANKLREGELTGKDLQSAMSPMIMLLQKIATNTGAGTDVKVGADSIATASKAAPQVRRGVAR